MIVFNQSSVGYSHIESGKPCQDHSLSYIDPERVIITACDGHGAKPYIRSEKGSKYASLSILQTFLELSGNPFHYTRKNYTIEKIRLNILCNWNSFIEKDQSLYPFRNKEMSALSEDERYKLRIHPERAYGTTLGGAMFWNNKIVITSLGDGECILLKKGECFLAFQEEEDDPVANITYSLCQEDAYHYIKVGIFDLREYDGVILCTDGTVNPYRNISNFRDSFVKPIIRNLLSEKEGEVRYFISDLGARIGIGDDVTFSAILKPGIQKRYFATKE